MSQDQFAAPEAHGRPRSRKLIFVLIGAGALVLAALAVGAVLLFSSAESTALDEILSQNLPRGTDAITLELMDPTSTALSSAFAESLCGGENIESFLIMASIMPNLAKSRLLSMNAGESRASLQCGDQARKLLSNKLVVQVLFEEDDNEHKVGIIETGIESLPLPKHTFSGYSGHCTPREDDEKECDEEANAAFREGLRWIFGKFKGLDIFARVRASSREHDSTNVEILRKIAPKVELDDLTMVRARPDTVPWIVACSEREPVDEDAKTDFLEACFPDNRDRGLEAINTKVRAVAMSRHAPDVAENDLLYSRVFTLLARDEDTVGKLQADVEDFVRDWKSHVSNKESTLIRTVRDASGKDSESAALIEPFIRAALGMTVLRDGEFVTVAIETELKPEEMSLLREAREEGRAQKDARAEIHKAVLTGSSLPRPALVRIVGDEVADWVLAKRATAEDCATMRSQFEKIVEGAKLQPEQYGIKFYLEKLLADDICVGLVLEDTTKECAASANYIEKFAECFPNAEVE